MKAIIWDLDDTLWHGTIYHGHKVKLKDETKEVLKQLKKLNIQQIVCTHNFEENAFKTLEETGIMEYFGNMVFASVKQEKDEMIKNILHIYELKPEEVVFIDDTPLNRALVKEKLGVHVDYMTDLYEVMKYFDTDRLILMNQQRNRTNAESEWKGDKKDFLKKINNKIEIREPKKDELYRMAILANRTNELNASFSRYNEENLEYRFNNDNYVMKIAHLSDDYGDYGLVGEIIIRKESDHLFVEDICVSCRTMGRGVGKALLKQIINEFTGQTIKGMVIKTEDNYRMPKLFESVGFKKEKEDGNLMWYKYE
jgi:FkbH-like protein